MLGPRIAALRRARGWSQSELAQNLQVSPSAIGMYEQGRREPSTELLVAMSRLFGVSVDYLLTGQTSIGEAPIVENAVDMLLEEADIQLESRRKRPLSRQELAVLFAALLMES
ncbi:MAG: helix-turn-helix transcriptional regulator [Ruminococcaceae bacterium]|nr:helix-turn-helix transcriptional regulator [Oscillospiraceae bacterium]